MSLFLCKDCCSEYNPLVEHYCLNDQWMPGVVETNRTSQLPARDLANLWPESTLASLCGVDTRALNSVEGRQINREFFNEDLLSNQVIDGNLNQNSSHQELAPAGTSNQLLSTDSGHGHIGDGAEGSSTDPVLNIDVQDAYDLYMQFRLGFPESEVTSNVGELTSRVLDTVLNDSSLISNTSMNSPVFPPVNRINDGMITNQTPSGYEFHNVEPQTTMPNDGFKLINRTMEENQDYSMSAICYENPAVTKNIIRRPKSLNETETERNTDNNRWPEMNHRFSVNGQNFQNIPMKKAFEGMTGSSTTLQFETSWPSVLSDIPTHESSFFYGSNNEQVRVETTSGAVPVPNSSNYVHALPGPTFLQPNKCNNPECSKISQTIVHTEPPVVVEIGARNCSDGQRDFEKKSYIRKQMNIQQSIKPYKCNVCGKAFRKKGHLKSHFAIHAGKKPFKCDACEETFTNRGNLRRHALIHKGERPYECEVCKKTFTNSGNLKRHALSHKGERPFKCGVCEQSFTAKWDLKRHARVHTGEKPFKCKVCEKTFSLSGNLKKHALIHKGERPFKCEVCQKAFTQKVNLNIHVLVHTRDRPFE